MKTENRLDYQPLFGKGAALLPRTHPEEGRSYLPKYWKKYISLNCVISLANFRYYLTYIWLDPLQREDPRKEKYDYFIFFLKKKKKSLVGGSGDREGSLDGRRTDTNQRNLNPQD